MWALNRIIKNVKRGADWIIIMSSMRAEAESVSESDETFLLPHLSQAASRGGGQNIRMNPKAVNVHSLTPSVAFSIRTGIVRSAFT